MVNKNERKTILNLDIHEVGLSNRAVKAFVRGFSYKHGYLSSNMLVTVNDLFREMTGRHNDILQWRCIGIKCYREYENALKTLGLVKYIENGGEQCFQY